MRSSLYGLYFFIITALLLLAIGGALYIVQMDYDSLIAVVTATVHKNGLGEKIRNGIFTRDRFALLQHVASLVFVLAPFCFWLAFRYRFSITGYGRFLAVSLSQSVKATRQVFKKNTPLQNRSVFALMAIMVLFFTWRMMTSFLNYDEMWSYNYYTDHPLYYSFFTFSNYPLFETSTHFFKWVPFPMKVNLRLPSFIFGIASCLLLYACCRKYFNHHFTAMAGLAAFAFMPLTIDFMVSARGVMQELFFAIAGIFSFLFWLNNPGRKKWLAIYFLAVVPGVYSMPTHFLLLLFLLAVALWMLAKKDRAAAFLFVKINVLIFACIVLLYAPMVLVTGNAVAGTIIGPVSYYGVIKQFSHVMGNVFMGYAGYSYVSMIVFAVAWIVLLLLKNKLPARMQPVLIMTAGLPLSAVFFYLVTGFDYAGRSLAFGGLAIPLLACLFVQMAGSWFDKNGSWKKGLAIPAIVLVLLLDNYFYHPFSSIDKDVAAVSRLFISNHIGSCYDNSSHGSHFYYYYPGIEYYYRVEHKTIALTLSAKNSMRYKALLPGDIYDCMVYDYNVPDSSLAGRFHELYRDPAAKFIIWMRNDKR